MSVHTAMEKPIVRTLDCNFWPEATLGMPMPMSATSAQSAPVDLHGSPDALAIVPVDPCTWMDEPSPDFPSPDTVPSDPVSTWTDVNDEPQVESPSIGHPSEEEWVHPPWNFIEWSDRSEYSSDICCICNIVYPNVS